MQGIIAILLTVLVYRHASGKARYNRALVFIMCVLSFITCIPALLIGWKNNPKRGGRTMRESWTEAL